MTYNTQLAYRTSRGSGLLNASPKYAPVPDAQSPEGNIRCCTYSGDGRWFAWASTDDVHILNASDGQQASCIPESNVYQLGFSPHGNFLTTWQRPAKDENGDATKNLKAWDLGDAATSQSPRPAVGQFVQKAQSGWNLQYTSDEKLCARLVTNEVHFYESRDLNKVWDKLRVEGLSDFALSPGPHPSVAVFVPERKGQPAAVKLFTVPKFDAPVSQKSFFKGDKVQFKWNREGTSLITLAQTEVDKSNKSYYGETNIYISSSSGEFESRIQLDKEGPIHDVAWSPNSKEFGIIYGYMPAKTTIFNTKAEALHSFSLGPRNTICFSPHGRFVLVAGFGNLAGQMDIYDLEKNYSKVTTIEASNASVCEWSPDGQHILTATTSPRLRVDNGIRIWHIRGQLMYNQDATELYDVYWQPQPVARFPLDKSLAQTPTPHSSASEYLSRLKTPSKPAGAYRPPGARGTSTPLHFKREDEGGLAYVNDGTTFTSGPIVNGFGKSRRKDVPGAELADTLPPGALPGGGVSLAIPPGGDEPASKSAVKNKRKREAKRAKDAAVATAGTTDETKDSMNSQPHVLAEHEGGDGDGNMDRNSDGVGRQVLGNNVHVHSDKGYEAPDTKHVNNPSQQRDGTYRSRQTAYAPGATPYPQARSHQPNERYQQENGHHHQRQQQQQQHLPLHQQQQRRGEAIESLPLPGPTSQSTGADMGLDGAGPGGSVVEEKKVRSLLKKIRAIEELKMRQAGGGKLEDTQLKKIGTEDAIRKELEALGVWS